MKSSLQVVAAFAISAGLITGVWGVICLLEPLPPPAHGPNKLKRVEEPAKPEPPPLKIPMPPEATPEFLAKVHYSVNIEYAHGKDYLNNDLRFWYIQVRAYHRETRTCGYSGQAPVSVYGYLLEGNKEEFFRKPVGHWLKAQATQDLVRQLKKSCKAFEEKK